MHYNLVKYEKTRCAMNKTLLDSKWKLYFFPQTKDYTTPADLASKESIPATVPGNVELDLISAGLLPEDIYLDENIKLAEKYEKHEWWYETEFKMPKVYGNTYLFFEGVDCLAEYWLDGEKIGESENAMIPAKIKIENPVEDKIYTLRVRLRSPILEADKLPYDILTMTYDPNFFHFSRIINQLPIRKPRHSYGWDIMPRAVSAGIWKEVFIISESDYDFNQLTYTVTSANADEADLIVFYELNSLTDECEITINAKCGDSEFGETRKISYKMGAFYLTVKNPKLWYPKNYGEQNLYTLKAEITKDGAIKSSAEIRLGIREAKLKRTDTTDGKNGDFTFYINGTPIQAYGSNWVPLDAYHSREKDRYERALALLDDIGCNIVRCWGGNVYPDDVFFDFCDEKGILVWQDFAMACATYPQDDAFLKKIATEVESVVRRLRNHPSIVLWAGDNECDQLSWSKFTGTENKITREVIPSILRRNDITRDYLPSSPYIAYGQAEETVSERHLWGSRDYFKSSYYANATAHFISEMGYHGCPSADSVRKFISGDIKVCEMKNSSACRLHSTNHDDAPQRFVLMEEQVTQLFGEVPQTLDDFALASQISQAEADKFFIESSRCLKPTRSGVIWWNLVDGWPQFSDAVVDYYFEKKLAYGYIKRVQEPVCVMVGEIKDWYMPIVIANDTSADANVEYEITDVESGEILAKGERFIEANGIYTLAKGIRCFYSEQKMLKICYTVNGEKKINHHLCGYPPFSYEKYKSWLSLLDF